MPLEDDAIQRGKCGLKLLQYMAAGLPTVASPVGVNAVILQPGTTGYAARTETEWRDGLVTLIRDAGQRATFGQAARQRCVQDYSIRRWLPELLAILDRVQGMQP
jgi:glycosyltransferase involved in cell wall biosynthesis